MFNVVYSIVLSNSSIRLINVWLIKCLFVYGLVSFRYGSVWYSKYIGTVAYRILYFNVIWFSRVETLW